MGSYKNILNLKNENDKDTLIKEFIGNLILLTKLI